VIKKLHTIILSILLFIIISPINTVHAAAGYFKVQNGQIFDPNGQVFIVKGITVPYGTFCGGDVNNYGSLKYWEWNGWSISKDLDAVKNLGANLIRIMIYPPGSTEYNNQYAAYYGTVAKFYEELDKVVQLGLQKGLVVYLLPAGRGDIQPFLDIQAYLAQTYKSQPYVWIGAQNEPNTCYDSTSCWTSWQQTHNSYVATLRSNGYLGPIVINAITWSWDHSRIAQYPLHDDKGNIDTNLIYGPHRYANRNTTFSGSEKTDALESWANLAATSNYAFVVDEVGYYNFQGAPQPTWSSEFIDYLTDWTLHQGGDGAIAFTWIWSDSNSMTNNNRQLDQWGTIFYNQYLTRIGQTSTPTPSPTPTSTAATPTPSPIPGDANSDRKVDGLDYIIWLNHYNTQSSRGRSVGDFNSDQKIDGIDYVIWLNNYN
jgi:hypothetical protein